MAAIANAIYDAIGARMRDLPISPPQLRAAIDAQEQVPRRRMIAG
jgi:CO/xanthine dehydrogenase Mo-binding subunit